MKNHWEHLLCITYPLQSHAKYQLVCVEHTGIDYTTF